MRWKRVWNIMIYSWDLLAIDWTRWTWELYSIEQTQASNDITSTTLKDTGLHIVADNQPSSPVVRVSVKEWISGINCVNTWLKELYKYFTIYLQYMISSVSDWQEEAKRHIIVPFDLKTGWKGGRLCASSAKIKHRHGFDNTIKWLKLKLSYNN